MATRSEFFKKESCAVNSENSRFFRFLYFLGGLYKFLRPCFSFAF